MNKELKYKIGDKVTLTGTGVIIKTDNSTMPYLIDFNGVKAWYSRDAIEQPIDYAADRRYVQDKNRKWWKILVAGLDEEEADKWIGYTVFHSCGASELRRYTIEGNHSGVLSHVGEDGYVIDSTEKHLIPEWFFIAVPVGVHETEQQKRIRELKETIKQASEQIEQLEKEVAK
jgi:hypothetical protein